MSVFQAVHGLVPSKCSLRNRALTNARPEIRAIMHDFGKAPTEFNRSSEKARNESEMVGRLAKKVHSF